MAAAGTDPASARRRAPLVALLIVLSTVHPVASSPLGDRGGVAAFEATDSSRVAATASAAGSDSAAAFAAAGASGVAAVPAAPLATVPVLSGAPGTGFTLRRAVNPRYRPPSTLLSSLTPGSVGRLRSMDHAHVRLTQRGAGASFSRDWDVALGQLYRRGDAIELSASGSQTPFRSDLRSLRLDGRRERLSGSLGDLPATVVTSVASLQRLRGGAFRFELPRGAEVRALGGVPTPVPGQRTARLAVGGATLDELPFEEGAITLGVVAFHRGTARAPAYGIADPDSLAGGGGMGSAGIRAPLPFGSLAFSVAGGWHDLDGHGGLAAQQALDWTWTTPRAALALHDQHATRRTRLVGTETLTLAPRQEERWNAQVRGAGGRVEAHLTGAFRAGGDTSLAARTLQAGASGSLPGSPWYSGLEFSADHRVATGTTERRLSLHAGEVSASGRALLFRLERSTNDAGRDALMLANETSLALQRGAQLAFEPRATWSNRSFEQGQVGSSVSWPLAWLSSRLTAEVAIGAAREQGFRVGLREAEISMVFAPRPRDRGEAEVRRMDDGGGRGTWEYGTSYDLQAARYENGGGWLSRRDSTRVTVHVGRSGNHSGVPDVLVSMDGKDLRFTDADGVARFDRVSPGVHVVAIEERSLPANYEPVSFSRVFVTVERGRLPDEVSFEIARPARKKTF